MLLGLGTVLFCVERGCRATFGLYYGVSFMGGMAGNVATDFASTVAAVVLGLIPFILLSLAPVVFFVIFRGGVVRDEGQEAPVRVIMAAVLVACQLTAYLVSSLGPVKNYYTYEFTVNTSVPHFGLLTSVRLELEYAVVGVPTAPLDAFLDDPSTTASSTRRRAPPPTRLARSPSIRSPPAPTRWTSTLRRWPRRRPTRPSRACTNISPR